MIEQPIEQIMAFCCKDEI
ncbi:hypothetical protein F383_38857 [Gossypium arboreum]|uniref:Uncharacterized protein n=1 Tax=Gossypium arboreum TaxID=29729 RepID=A0A0B0MLJ1_GOSAR|nr:hypothetical protein F383_38857 [Gossypium arboreum]